MAGADRAPGEPDREKRLKAVMRSVHTIKEVDFDFDRIYVASFPEKG